MVGQRRRPLKLHLVSASNNIVPPSSPVRRLLSLTVVYYCVSQQREFMLTICNERWSCTTAHGHDGDNNIICVNIIIMALDKSILYVTSPT